MKKLIYSFAFLVSLLSVVGCKSLLDLKPPVDSPIEESLNNANDLETAVNGAYFSFNNAMSFVVFYGDLLSDHIRIFDQSSVQDLDIFNRNLGPKTGDEFWNSAYKVINRSNNIIAAINADQTSDRNTVYYKINKSRLLGEAYLLRAIMNFELVKFYGHQYGYLSSQPNTGVVLRTEPTISKSSKERASVADVYKLIEADLQIACDSLPIDFDPLKHPRSYNNRATKAAAYGYMAKVLFQKANKNDNKKALKYLAYVLNNDTTGYETKTGLTTKYVLGSLQRTPNVYSQFGDGKDPEAILQLFSYQLDNQTKKLLQKYNYTNEGTELFSQYIQSDRFSLDVGNVVGNSLDNRLGSVMFPPVSQRGLNVFVNKKYSSTTPFNLPILRSAELLLMRAEINFLDGKTSQALTDINILRSRAEATLYLISDLDINSIKKERITEMCFEGDRIHAFRRMGMWDRNYSSTYNVCKMKSRNSNPTSFENFTWNANSLLFFIPDDESFANPDVIRENIGSINGDCL